MNVPQRMDEPRAAETHGDVTDAVRTEKEQISLAESLGAVRKPVSKASHFVRIARPLQSRHQPGDFDEA